jgi:hypothetical protein
VFRLLFVARIKQYKQSCDWWSVHLHCCPYIYLSTKRPNLSKSNVWCRPIKRVPRHDKTGESLVFLLPYFQVNVNIWTLKATGILSHIPVEKVEKYLLVYGCCTELDNTCEVKFTIRRKFVFLGRQYTWFILR